MADDLTEEIRLELRRAMSRLGASNDYIDATDLDDCEDRQAAFQALGGRSDIITISNDWQKTKRDDEVLELLRRWIATDHDYLLERRES